MERKFSAGGDLVAFVFGRPGSEARWSLNFRRRWAPEPWAGRWTRCRGFSGAGEERKRSAVEPSGPTIPRATGLARDEQRWTASSWAQSQTRHQLQSGFLAKMAKRQCHGRFCRPARAIREKRRSWETRKFASLARASRRQMVGVVPLGATRLGACGRPATRVRVQGGSGSSDQNPRRPGWSPAKSTEAAWQDDGRSGVVSSEGGCACGSDGAPDAPGRLARMDPPPLQAGAAQAQHKPLQQPGQQPAPVRPPPSPRARLHIRRRGPAAPVAPHSTPFGVNLPSQFSSAPSTILLQGLPGPDHRRHHLHPSPQLSINVRISDQAFLPSCLLRTHPSTISRRRRRSVSSSASTTTNLDLL